MKERRMIPKHVPEDLIRDSDAFVAAVTDSKLDLAWEMLRDRLFPALRDLEFRQRIEWLLMGMNLPKLHDLRNESTTLWLDALRSDSLATHTLPPVSELLLALAELGFCKRGLYRPTLWNLASGINDIRIAHPTRDLRPALDELMHVWRICTFSAVYPAGRSEGPPVEKLRYTDDWSFLPTPTLIAAGAARYSFDEVLRLIVVVGRDPATEGRGDDYAGSALITLDLLRTSPSSDLKVYRPWRTLIETMLKRGAPTKIPPCLWEKLQHESEEVRKRYWDLLRRVGVKRDVVENAARAMDEKISRAKSENQQLEGEKTQHQQLEGGEKSQQVEEGEQPQNSLPEEELQIIREPDSIKFTHPPADPRVEELATQLIRRLARALERNHVKQAEAIRQEVAALAASHPDDPTFLPIEVYERLMMVLFGLGRPRSAIEVWKKFLADGYVPTVKTYTVLMQGACHAHDVTTQERFWYAMRNLAGLQPDPHAWSIHIMGLFRAKLPHKGLATLEQMGKEWYIAARNAEYESAGVPPPDRNQKAKKNAKASSPEPTLEFLLSKYPSAIGQVPRPDLVIFNSAVAAVVSSRLFDELPKVLKWGRTFGIEPDLITYNSLLNVCMRFSRGEEALKIVSRMQSRGIEADSTTWTVLLTALFHSGFLDNLEPEAQGRKIIDFIRSVEVPADGEGEKARGLDTKGYALIIDRLLKHHHNPAAAAEVLNHMVIHAGLQPSTHIYTILMASYFHPPDPHSPPDWNSIDALWTQLNTADPTTGKIPSLDNIFYDRMIEGYAEFHHLVGMKPAFDMMDTMGRKGLRPGYGALEKVARMLVQRGELQRLTGLVEKVASTGRGTVMYQKQTAFWDFVHDSGVLGGNSVEDFLRERGGWGRGKHWREGEI